MSWGGCVSTHTWLRIIAVRESPYVLETHIGVFREEIYGISDTF